MGEYKNGTTPSILYQKGGVDMEEESGTQTKADDLVHCEIDPFPKILTLTNFHPNLTHFCPISKRKWLISKYISVS